MADLACENGLTHSDAHFNNIGYNVVERGIQLQFIDFGMSVASCLNPLLDIVAMVRSTLFTGGRARAWIGEVLVAELKRRAPRARFPPINDYYGWDDLYGEMLNANSDIVRLHGNF
jgi:hypothetical protein